MSRPDAGLPSEDTSPVSHLAKQTKTDDDDHIGLRGPGANVMNKFLRPHFAEVPPVSLRFRTALMGGIQIRACTRARGVSAIYG